MQEEIAESIVRATGGELIRAGAAHADKASAHELDAWGLVRKAYHFWNYGFDVSGIAEALDLLRQAIQLDPAYANAHAFLALYLIERVVLMLTPTPDADRTEADNAAAAELELAPQDPEVLENVGLVWLHCGEYEKSVEALRRAVGIAPFNLVAWGYLGLTLGWGGKERDAGSGQNPEQAHNRHSRTSFSSLLVLLSSLAPMCGCTLRGSRRSRQRCVELQPRFYVARITLANALGQTGKLAEARDEMAQVMAVNPYVSEALLETEYGRYAATRR